MSMTREEAIEELERLLSHWDDLENGKRSFRWYSKAAIEVALSALRPVSREQVEKVWRGEWAFKSFYKGTSRGAIECQKCKSAFEGSVGFNFCPHCGAPMTDEAVQMVMERIEAIR